MDDLGDYVRHSAACGGAHLIAGQTRLGQTGESMKFAFMVGSSRYLKFGFTGAALILLVAIVGGCVAVDTHVSRDTRSNEGLASNLLSPEQLPLNYFQFFGSHNSYKTAISDRLMDCLLYTSPSPRDLSTSRMPSSA